MATQPRAARLGSPWAERGKGWGVARGARDPGSSQALQLLVRLPPPAPVRSRSVRGPCTACGQSCLCTWARELERVQLVWTLSGGTGPALTCLNAAAVSDCCKHFRKLKG